MMGDTSVPDDYLRSFCVPLRFRLPVCKHTTDFVRSFQASTAHHPESRALVERLTACRARVAYVLTAADVKIPEKVEAVQQYLPPLFALFHSLNRQDRVLLDVPLMFEWRGAFCFSPETFTKFPEVIYEVLMTLHALAILHHCQAWEALSASFVNNLSYAGQQFLASAGIMEYMATDLIPMWVSSASPSVRPAETDLNVCLCMKELFTAEAQMMCCIKAAPSSSAGIMTKLTVAVIRLVDKGIDLLRHVPNVRLGFDTDVAFFNRGFFSSLVYYYQAEAMRANDETCGVALGYYREARGRLHDLCDVPFAATKVSLFSKYAPLTPALRGGVNHLSGLLTTKSAAAERDNNLIFFQAVPAAGELPPLPDGAYLMVCKKYLPPPDSDAKVYAFGGDNALPAPAKGPATGPNTALPTKASEKTGLEALWSTLGFGAPTASAATGMSAPMPTPPTAPTSMPQPSAPPAPAKTDYEIALELQRKLDNGEDG
jgi:hypothetical protein